MSNQMSICGVGETFAFPNPAINFTVINPLNTHVFEDENGQANEGVGFLSLDHVRRHADTVPFDTPVVLSMRSLGSPSTCVALPQAGTHVFMLFNHSFYKFDPRLVLEGNTIDQPADSEGSKEGQCPSVVKNFINEASCVHRPSCAPLSFSSVTIPLNDTTLRLWYLLSTKHVHYITGLRLEGEYAVSPCSGTSRWRRIEEGPCQAPNFPTALDNDTRITLTAALASSAAENSNPYVRDITVDSDSSGLCLDETNGVSTVGARVEVNGACWGHTHPDELNVYDFTSWTFKHAGNKDALSNGRPNPITQFAELGRADFVYPWHHAMARWATEKKNGWFPHVGRFGDDAVFSSLPTSVQTSAMADRFGALATRSTAGGVEACGSRAEVANDNTLGNQYYMHTEAGRKGSQDKYLEGELEHPYDQQQTKGAVWTNVVLKADDQLRQRVGWALSQVLVLGEMQVHGDESEPWHIFYDTCLRHSFGNYRDLLQEVTYSPMMGEYLTYHQGKSIAAAGTYPDENFARESMQLFTMGLWKLNDDGTPVVGTDGEPVSTYDNDDIATFARVWTGFDLQPTRSNVALQNGRGSENYNDPMAIKPSWRDKFPKAKLDSGYLGDGVPLCSELQPRYFLSKGAHYRYIGTDSAEGAAFDASAAQAGLARFEPAPATSALFQSLCSVGTAGNCTFPVDVVLDQTLTCDGIECTTDRLRSVKLVDASSGKIAWYESLRPRCARLSFAANTVYTKLATTNARHQCSDRASSIATVACCNHDIVPTEGGRAWGALQNKNTATASSFAAEMVTYRTAEARCAARGEILCDTHAIVKADRYTKGGGDGSYSWLKKPCAVQVQVRSNGWINIVEPQPAGSTLFNDKTESNAEFSLDSPNVFRIRWHNNTYPTAASGCKGVGDEASNCTVANDDTCLCDITVEDTAVFTDATKMPSEDELEAALFIGAVAPGEFEEAAYTKCTSEACADAESGGIRLYNKAREHEPLPSLGMESVFELPSRRAGSGEVYLRNRGSTVRVGGGFSFRNPPNFMPLLGEIFNQNEFWGESTALRDAEWEVEALLDHIFEHDTTAPFIAHKLLQRLVSSNPSPRYVSEVVTAFRTGAYPPAGRPFSGRYGDLGAAVAAVLLDREARSSSLDADPSHGKLQEPLLKVLHVMRAMEYTPNDGREVILNNMHNKVGMAPFMSPSVFNFFLSDFQSAGPIADAALVSPEGQLSTTPLMVSYLNGISSLIDHGLTSCDSGFGVSEQKPARKCKGAHQRSGETRKNADGLLTFAPKSTAANEVVDELDLLLTAGRLSKHTKHAMASAYNATLASSGSLSTALQKAQKLAVIAPEFHATNRNVGTHHTREPVTEQVSQGRPFKAIVVITLEGGCDSFNLLVPHSGCTANGEANDLFAEYKTARTNLALDQTKLLQIDSPAGSESAGTTTQPCTKFGLHPSLEFLQEMYSSGSSAWIANIGALVEPTTPVQFRAKSTKLPPSLFAHNVQQRVMHNVHAQYTSAHGVLGRAITSLMSSGNEAAPYSSQLFSLMGNTKLLEGAPQAPVIINPKNGIAKYNQYSAMSADLANITQPAMSSLFAETYSQNLGSLLGSMEGVDLGTMLRETTLDSDDAFDAQHKASDDATVWKGGLSLQFKQVAKVLKRQADLNLERAAFSLKLGGFDTHEDVDGQELKRLMTDVDQSLKVFVAELKAQGLWENVTIVTVSDFGRTLSSNGRGSDHAWGGNHFVLGGSVNGGKIFGKFPPSLALDSEQIATNRGAVLPSTSWEGMWKGLVEWFGVEDHQIATVLPNLAKFPAGDVISGTQMFN
jgi:cullin-associated NEDD8-dissociated protein 1